MELKVISLNMWHGGRLLSQILEFLQTENADVICLQEVYNGSDSSWEDNYRSVEVLRDKLSYEYFSFEQTFVQAMPFGEVPEGLLVLSRFPILETVRHQVIKGTRASYPDTPDMWPILPAIVQHVELDTPVGVVNVCNVHGVWDLDGDNPGPKRQRMVDIMLSATAEKNRVILMGDTNAKPTNPAMQRLEAQLNPVFDANELKTTFNMRRKDNPGYATAAVDLMYISPDMRVVSKACPDIDVSDHLPLVVTVEV